MYKFPILAIYVHAITYAQLIQKVSEYLADNEPTRLIFTPNPEIIYRARADERLQQALNASDINLPDGTGVLLAARIYRYPIKERVTGIDACLALCKNLPVRVFLLGSKPGISERAAHALKNMFPAITVCGYHHGYFSDDETENVLDKINRSGANVLFVGLGAPRQEMWLLHVKERLRVRVAMVVGGTLDVISGEKKRAPLVFQKLRLEWLYRLLQEPRRIGRMSVLPLFLFSVLADNCKKAGNTIQCP